MHPKQVDMGKESKGKHGGTRLGSGRPRKTEETRTYTFRASFAKDCLSREITDNYPVWIAHYGRDLPSFEGWRWWQFTDKAVVKGVPGRVDLNVTPAAGFNPPGYSEQSD